MTASDSESSATRAHGCSSSESDSDSTISLDDEDSEEGVQSAESVEDEEDVESVIITTPYVKSPYTDADKYMDLLYVTTHIKNYQVLLYHDYVPESKFMSLNIIRNMFTIFKFIINRLDTFEALLNKATEQIA